MEILKSNKKKIIIGVAAFTALASAVLIFRRFRKVYYKVIVETQEPNQNEKQSNEEQPLSSQKTAQVNEQSSQESQEKQNSTNQQEKKIQVPKETLLKIFAAVKDTFPTRLLELKQSFKTKRQKYFKNKEWENYKQTVQEYLQESQMLDDQILQQTLQSFQITQNDFDFAVDNFVNDEDVKQMVKTVFAASMTTSSIEASPQINEEGLQQIINYQIQRAQEMAKDVKLWGKSNVLLFAVQDEIEEKFGYTEEQINYALKKFSESNPQKFKAQYERMESINAMFLMYGNKAPF